MKERTALLLTAYLKNEGRLGLLPANRETQEALRELWSLIQFTTLSTSSDRVLVALASELVQYRLSKNG